jgi:oligopeptide/dipeptide ABC transporter ATP-binding protein
MDALLSVRNLRTHFHTARGWVHAVDDVSFDIPPATVVGLVGESGSGKSVTGLSILRLVATPPGAYRGGAILWRGTDLLKLTPEQMRVHRGSEIAMIFQEPMTSLNPVFTVGNQVGEVLEVHTQLSRAERKQRVIELLREVGIASPEERYGQYPNQLSGGMRQRVMIAMALACNPALLIADEPTTALDVTIQAQILDLILRLKEKYQMSVLLITHDLGVVAETTSRVMVMYAGRIVEQGPTGQVLAAPLHPYTAGLLASLPDVGAGGARARLKTIQGLVPDLIAPPPRCRFLERCANAGPRCGEQDPALDELAPGQWAACFHPMQPGKASGARPPAGEAP